MCYFKSMRKDLLTNGEIYHVFTKSIADYKIFNQNSDFERMLQLIKYYQVENDLRLSYFIKLKLVQNIGFNGAFNVISKGKNDTVQIIAYCLMPTHIHLVLKQLLENGISEYMRKILDGYTRYFNTIHKRKGPLWEGRFKSVLVDSDEQLRHLVRYLHLNPTTANLATKPEEWFYSSYKEYLGEPSQGMAFCHYDDILPIEPKLYRKFVNDQISYQRELGKMKKLLLD